MLDGINDSIREARELVKLVGSFPSHINLIPFNPWPGSSFKASPFDKLIRFKKVLENYDIPCTIRTPRGQDIMAAW